jgi:hypothetical protein
VDLIWAHVTGRWKIFETQVSGVALPFTGKLAVRPTFLEKRTGERAGRHDRQAGSLRIVFFM